MRCPRCQARTLPSVNVCRDCGHLGEHQLAVIAELRAGSARVRKMTGAAGIIGAGVLLALSVPAAILFGPYGGGLVAMLGMGAGAAGAQNIEEARLYRQLRHVTPEQLSAAERRALPSAGGASTSVAFPTSE